VKKAKKKTDPFARTSHHEHELKFEVTDADITSDMLVRRLMQALGEYVYTVYEVGCPDTYYRQGRNVCRFRAQPGAGELTVKLRTSKTDITDRVEVDIPLAASVTEADTEAFLLATGWKPELKLVKTSTIIHVATCRPTPGLLVCPPVVIAYYKVYAEGVGDPARSFIEVELDKESFSGLWGPGRRRLEGWHAWLQTAMDVWLVPATLSLYELYTGRTYQLAKEKCR
jgi:hypothetical protein